MYSFKDYDILEKLGAGSFGSVYKARHRKSLSIYAIKVIDQKRITSSAAQIPIEYIQREVAVLKKLSHPNIVGLTEYTVEGDSHVLAMEYCSGLTLDQYISKRRLGEDTTRGLLKQLASGLKYMWSKNIIHRDLKPQNILFSSKSSDSQLKIIDFGFSRMRTANNLMTSIVGTPIYMAPELLRC
jgi:serine/threonine protein kinase